MAITLYGVDPAITEVEWAQLFALATDENVSGMAVTPTGATRTVSVATGSAGAAGVLAKSTTAVTKALAANPSGNSRIDAVVLEIDWSGSSTTGGTIEVVQGQPGTNPQRPALTQNAGGLWQVALAYVTVTAGKNNAFSDDQVADARPGRRRTVVHRATPGNNSTELDTNESMGAGVTDPKVIGTIVVPDPGWPWRPRVSASMKFAGLSGSGFGRLDVTLDGSSIGEGRAPAKNDGIAQVYAVGAPQTGKVTFRLRMLPQQMSGEQLESTSAYASFVVEVEPV